jgi:8-oxo-dGTP diphosphatase
MNDEKRIYFAVKALIISDGKFLAVRKSGGKPLKYELPGGRMEFGETAEETVVREVYEETGLSVTPVKVLDTWNFIKDSLQITGIIYLCASANTASVVLSDEHDGYEWLAPDEQSFGKMNRIFRPQLLKLDWHGLIAR